MKHSALSSLSVLSLLIGTLTLVGCGGAFNMPDSVLSSQAAGPPIQGSVFGGHAPIVGAHVYLLQPGTSGYGSIATSILGTGTSTSPGGYTLHTNTATGGDPSIPAGWQYVITDANGEFNLTNAYSCAAGQPVYTYGYGGNATGGTATNTGTVQLAILGNCPATGQSNFGGGSSSQINYVYSNEVSTVAAAYVFQPFTATATTTATSSAIYVGTSGTSQGLLGIQNAASTAAQLYDIQGRAGQSTVIVGEGHVANFRTQSLSIVGGLVVYSPNAGNGVVPQATIDTLANILAACIDSTGATSTQCSTLFTNATESGDSAGTKPTDTARAAMNIARYPAGNYSTTSTPTNFVTNIYGLSSGVVPYTPHLTTQPHDFTIAINYPYNTVGGYSTSNTDVEKAESIEVDQLGQIWITAQGSGGNSFPYPSADRWSPLGAVQTTNNTAGTTPAGYIFGYVSIDGGNNAWTGNANSTTGIFEAGSNGSFSTTFGSGFSTAYTVITDKTGNAYFFAGNANATPFDTYTNSEMWEYNSGGTLVSTSSPCNTHTGPFSYYCISQATGGGRTSIFDAGTFVAHGAIDASGDFWLTSENSPWQIARVTPTGGQVWEISTGVQQPEFPAIDHAGNGWIPNYEGAGVYKITSGGTSTTLTSASTGGALVYPFGSAVDGNGNVWVTIRCGPTNTCGNVANTSTLVEINGANNLAISPPTNYSPQTQYPASSATLSKIFLDPLNLAIDPSGNLWITNYVGTTSGSVVEIIGSAAPVVTPLSLAAGNNALGVKP
jgi:hypothetical protein